MHTSALAILRVLRNPNMLTAKPNGLFISSAIQKLDLLLLWYLRTGNAQQTRYKVNYIARMRYL